MEKMTSCTNYKKEFANELNRTLLLAKARAYSNVSLERKLTNKEYNEYKKVMETLGITPDIKK